jgi:hypothetical protein
MNQPAQTAGDMVKVEQFAIQVLGDLGGEPPTVSGARCCASWVTGLSRSGGAAS